jgi:4-hydroxy-2-oxoheptanedioate aldolase
MKWIKKRVVDGEVLGGTFLNLGVGCAAEIAGRSGLDWVLIDAEHGLGDHTALVESLLCARLGDVSPIVRVVTNEAEHFKRAMDFGAAGIMVPHINNAEDACRAVLHMKYPPQGMRGLTRSSRATSFGYDAQSYLRDVRGNELLILQIETKESVLRIEEIAAVPGVDVLFVGPADLSFSYEVPCDLDEPLLRTALEKVLEAASRHGKRTGIFVRDDKHLPALLQDGFTMIALDTDMGILKTGIENIAKIFDTCKTSTPHVGNAKDTL